MRELVDLAGFDGSNLVPNLRRRYWELRVDPRAARTLAVDVQRRVVVPVGVRHQLGLTGAVLVSLAADRSRIFVWSASRLDDLLEVDA